MKSRKKKNPNRVAAGRKSKRKGNGNERDMAQAFKAWWGVGEWARVPASGGWGNQDNREGFRACGDIMTTDVEFPFTVEVKHQEAWELDQMLTAPACKPYEWWQQTKDETLEGTFPLLVMRRNRRKPLVVMEPYATVQYELASNSSARMILLNGTEELIVFKLEDFFKISKDAILRMSQNLMPKCNKCKKVLIKCKCAENQLDK